MRTERNDKTDDGVCKSSRTREILTTTGQNKPQMVVEGELTSRRVFCRGRPQADWELRKPNVRSSRGTLFVVCLPLEPNSVAATIPG